MKSWLTVDHLSVEIRQNEHIWVQVYNEKNEYYNFDEEYLKDIHYSLWSRKASNKMTIRQWKEIRFNKIAACDSMLPVVYFDNGLVPQDHTTLWEVRNTNLTSFFQTGLIYFKFDCPTKDVAYRIKEKLYGEEYNLKVDIHNGWILKFYEVYGLIQPVRIFPWEFNEWHEMMLGVAKMFSSYFKTSFYKSSEFDKYHNL
jgi:hypothetical protein